MRSSPPSPFVPCGTPRDATSRRWSGALLLLLIAVALRCWDFGNPVIHVDEQYYLLVGDRMWRGAMPYVDIWDRKPIGLFLLYAGIRALPGDGILAYQVTATLFAAATAIVVRAAALRIGAGRVGALVAGITYLLWLPLLGGRGGQSPVFYNLLVAAGALMTLGLPALAERGGQRRIAMSGLATCLIVGVAIQMKYTPVFEGAFFGIAHVLYLQRAGATWRSTLAAATAFALAGAAPTLAAIGWYRALGPAAFDAFWFANVTSIALRPGYPVDQIIMRLLGIAAQLSPLILATMLSWRWRSARVARALTIGWLAAALAGFLAIGTFFDHYALPLIAPLCVAGSVALGRSPRLRIAVIGFGLTLFAVERAFIRDDAPGAREVARIVRLNSGSECPYVFIGDTVTYLLAKACLPTAYAFPNLLAYTTEQGATGIDEAAEERRILARRPPVIVSSDRRLAIWNQGSVAALNRALRDYRLVYTTPRENYRTRVYLRRDLPLRR